MPGATLDDLERFLGRDLDVTQALQHLDMMTAFARAHTRGRGFTDGVPADDIATVIVTATARLMANPQGTVAETTGPFSIRYGEIHGFNLMELAVLNGYRRRAS